MKYFSMFSGIGGFEYGIQQALGDRAECIGYSEVDKYAEAIYKFHYPEHPGYGDAKTLSPEILPEFQLLVGGFPCQAFSVAGKGRGFCDTRGTLFFEIARILEEKKPEYILLENVRGLLSNDKGRTFQTIIGVLTDLGYVIEWALLNSKDFGVPQNRERVFIAGHLRGGSRRQILPVGGASREDYIYGREEENQIQNGEKRTEMIYDGLNDRLKETNISPTLSSVNCKSVTNRTGFGIIDYVVKSDKKDYRTFSDKGIAPTLQARSDTHKLHQVAQVGENDSEATRVYDTEGISRTIKNGGGMGAKTGLYAIPVLTPERENKRQNGRRFKEDGEPSFTITAQDKHGVYDGCKIRRLTPTECERLQGFPNGWTDIGCFLEEGYLKISDSQRYKTLGNAVTTNVVTAIMKQMFGEI